MCNVYTWMLRQWPHFKLLRCFSDTNDDTKYHFHQSFICWPSFQIPGQEYLWWEQAAREGAGRGNIAGVTLWSGCQSVRHRTCDTGGRQALKWTSGVWRGLWPSRGDTRHRIRMLNQLASNNTSVDRDLDVDTAKGGSSVILSSHRVTIEAGTTQGVSLYTAYRVLESVPWAVSSDSGGPAWLETPAWPWLGPVWCRHHTRPHQLWTLCQVRNSEKYVISEKDD